ncbi:MAG: prepilin peptidase [Erysipelotrichaceae bacterium]|nr:prepilin peptidase [Erysipelotrichaceae bacterium]
MDSDLYIIFLLFMIGTCMGSFLSCLSFRLIRKQDWLFSRSCCQYCGHLLGFLDLIPVFSYLFLKGRCRYCHHKLDREMFISELGSALVFVLTYLKHGGIDLFLVRDLILFSALIGLSMVDEKTYLIPDGFVIAGIINWFLSLIFMENIKDHLIRGLGSALFLSGLIFLMYLGMKLLCDKEGIGGGDIKLLFMVGLYLDLYKGSLVLLISSLLGIIRILKNKKRMIAFGPCIALACFIVIILG